jgi:hypothetical protein
LFFVFLLFGISLFHPVALRRDNWLFTRSPVHPITSSHLHTFTAREATQRVGEAATPSGQKKTAPKSGFLANDLQPD